MEKDMASDKTMLKHEVTALMDRIAKKNSDHVVVNAKEQGRFECRLCGETMMPEYPVNVSTMQPMIDKFIAEHIDCEDEDEPECEEEEDETCGRCNGSGEGMYDGSTCSSCGGAGEISRPGPEPDWDAMADAQKENAAGLAERDEVDWESPE
jgi:hypothetical protein